jgi:hypothetical protein
MLHSYSQDTLGMGANGKILNIDTSSSVLTTDSFDVYIKNFGNTIVTGTINVNAAIDTGSGPTFWFSDTLTVVNMNPDDSVLEHMNVVYPSCLCRIGANIVVIWPSKAGALTLDSAYATVTLTGPSSVLELDPNKKLIVYPNPTTDFIKIRSEVNNSTGFINKICLFDISGKVIEEFGGNTVLISMYKYPAGTYLLKVDYKDSTYRQFKIIRQ